MPEGNITGQQRIIPVDIEAEMKKSWIDYAMSVIVDRALPDVRDGLKPVHRRILYAMYGNRFTPDRPHRKCATTVGEVLGKFHPHGDLAVYDSLVRMAQKWSMRYQLIDGHGNFGSIDGDSPAAYRYTEARLTRMSLEMIRDIEKDTVNFKPNFDDREMEPVVLPSRFPNLLVNGSTGIAVAMATNIPPHNLGEVVDGIIKVIDEPETTIEQLMSIIKGPDFPTSGQIIGIRGIKDAYTKGKGRIVMRARTQIEEIKGNRQKIIVTELPYQVNKARLIEKIAALVKEKRIEGISNLNDESDRTAPVRIVIELKKDVNANVILNQLYKYTQLQDSFNANMLALVETEEGKYDPRVMNLRHIIDHYIAHQKEVIERRTKFELEKAEARAHILEGLKIALDNLDEVISIIRSSQTEAAAKEKLMERFSLSDRQAQAIVDMRLGRLTGLEREKLEKEYQALLEKIKYYRKILANEHLVLGIVKDELSDVKKRYADERRTELVADETEIDIEDLIEEQRVAITMTHLGYIKRLPADTYKSQRRGGRGIMGLVTREKDFVESLYITSSHNYLLFFTNRGLVYRLKAYQIPESGRQAKGMAIVNLLELDPGEKITAVIPIPDFEEGLYLTMATRKGFIKKTDLMQYRNIRRGGLTAVVLRDNDELIDVKLTDGDKKIILVTRNGRAIKFNEKDARPIGRVSMGVKGINLHKSDYIIGMEVCTDDDCLLIVTENGFGKRTSISEYRLQSRAGKGILTYRITNKTGKLTGMKLVNDSDDIMLISNNGTIIRMNVNEINVLSRVTQGVTLMRTKDDVKVVGLARIREEDEEEETEAEVTAEEVTAETIQLEAEQKSNREPRQEAEATAEEVTAETIQSEEEQKSNRETRQEAEEELEKEEENEEDGKS